MDQETKNIYERYRRPSCSCPFPNPYSFDDFEQTDGSAPIVTKKFHKPENVILAYWGILNQASNMLGYSGGCGSIGVGLNAYPYAYDLFTPKMKSKMSLKQFIDLFKGIGYITLLELMPAYFANEITFMVEIETIQGEEEFEDRPIRLGSQFVYYYGIMTVRNTDKGYLINRVDLIPEDFLCAPEHSWFYMADAVVEIVYKDNLKIVDRIDKIEQRGKMTYIYASGCGKQYRFDFVRITNGYDILLHENILENCLWKEINIPTNDWNLKLQ